MNIFSFTYIPKYLREENNKTEGEKAYIESVKNFQRYNRHFLDKDSLEQRVKSLELEKKYLRDQFNILNNKHKASAGINRNTVSTLKTSLLLANKKIEKLKLELSEKNTQPKYKPIQLKTDKIDMKKEIQSEHKGQLEKFKFQLDECSKRELFFIRSMAKMAAVDVSNVTLEKALILFNKLNEKVNLLEQKKALFEISFYSLINSFSDNEILDIKKLKTTLRNIMDQEGLVEEVKRLFDEPDNLVYISA